MSQSKPPPLPLATYRLQFNADFTFADATSLAPYLARLGISHVYASPYFKARAGSTHGYDITDPNKLNPEIGDDTAFDAMCRAFAEHGLGQLLDFVPNHMGVGMADNAWWLDVLEWGRESPHAAYFDIDWEPMNPDLRGKVLLPVLGDHYGSILEQGELRLRFDEAGGSFSLCYYDHRFPIAPSHYRRLLARIRERLGDPVPDAFDEILAGFNSLAGSSRSQRQRGSRRQRAGDLKRRLADLAQGPAIAEAIAATLRDINGTAGDPPSMMVLHRLLELQSYRLAYWRVAANEINYRRFFDINDLAGLRVELPEVFVHTHRLVLRLLAEGKVHGLRIDHIDGLYDPADYCRQLQHHAAAVLPDLDPEAGPAPLYVVVEKILAAHELLREDWLVAGTTGYEFTNLVNGLLVDAASQDRLDRIYQRFIGQPADFDRMLYDAKKRIMDTALASELSVLANELWRIARSHWRSRDFTFSGLHDALREVVACFPVYRTYLAGRQIAPEDRQQIDWALALARKRSEGGDPSVFAFLHGALTGDLAQPDSTGYNRRQVIRFAMKFQQYTGPVMAKGLEDTTFYRYVRLLSSNEVGGDPRRFGVSPSAFHRVSQDRRRRWPQTMLSTATHDTKRGEDARARISALSELPDEWGKRVRRWSRANRLKRRTANGGPAPDPKDEFLLYQALLGSWPQELAAPLPFPEAALEEFRSRMEQYMTKAMREAKQQSSWHRPDEEYEAGVIGFLGDLLNNSPSNPFLADFLPFQQRVARLGLFNSLSQTLLKLTVPGVPDIYRGTELWDFSLVDPDNRRPVDWAGRQAMLAEIEAAERDDPAGLPSRLMEQWRSGQVKLYTAWVALRLRRRQPRLFTEGDYLPLEAAGTASDHVVAFARTFDGQALLVAVPRLVSRLLAEPDALPHGPDCWRDTILEMPEALSGRSWRNLLGGGVLRGEAGRLAAAELFGDFPVALLLSDSV